MTFLRSLRIRLAIWFTVGVFAIVAVFVLATLYHLKEELIREKASLEHPNQPDYVRHGSLDSDAEIAEIMEDLIWKTSAYAGPMLVAVIALGWFLAKRSLRPIAELNRQLGDVRAQNLEPNLALGEADREFQDHVGNLNLVLSRLGKSFEDLRGYAAKVAHELRTPLTILRLKVEKADNDIAPELREELSEELERLNHVVDQSLLIAQADRGSIRWDEKPFDLADLLRDMVEDFSMLASEDKRELILRAPVSCEVVTDIRYVKQILHGYLSNALKHGDGVIEASLVICNSVANVAIVNGVCSLPRADQTTLGLGLRVIRALVDAQSHAVSEVGYEEGGYRATLSVPMP